MLSPPRKRRRCEPPAASLSPRSCRMPGRGATLAGVPQIPSMVAFAPAPVKISMARRGLRPSPILESPAVCSLPARRPPSPRPEMELKIGEFAHGQIRVRLAEMAVFREIGGQFLEGRGVCSGGLGKGRCDGGDGGGGGTRAGVGTVRGSDAA